ncbi:MAG: hypothetical protein NWS71_05745 [Opitutales bacterium]|jgi:hypothetical protein|nr:hypothetical protein [Opitutales bacterium]MDP4777419.1 hypothetical protein [Opitutales bacterium]MDP4883107.1 hypothetical protein [Opitutales bacterium]
MKKSEEPAVPKIFTVVGILIVVGLIADLVDFVFYRMHLAGGGIGWLDRIPWSVTWEYLSSPLGACLTILGLAPWLVLWAWLYIKR